MMGIYGLQEQFWAGDYQFDLGFSNDATVGLSQRDVYVSMPRKVEDLTLADFTGPQWLQAYRGPDAEQRGQNFADSRQALATSYTEARRAPHANATRLLRHEKRELRRLEKALAQEWCELSPSLFELACVQEQGQPTQVYHFLRSFSFEEVQDRSIHNFCRLGGKTLLVPSRHEELTTCGRLGGSGRHLGHLRGSRRVPSALFGAASSSAWPL